MLEREERIEMNISKFNLVGIMMVGYSAGRYRLMLSNTVRSLVITSVKVIIVGTGHIAELPALFIRCIEHASSYGGNK
jgi:hypothetical protein